jgi:hypothetical protein
MVYALTVGCGKRSAKPSLKLNSTTRRLQTMAKTKETDKVEKVKTLNKLAIKKETVNDLEVKNASEVKGGYVLIPVSQPPRCPYTLATPNNPTP